MRRVERDDVAGFRPALVERPQAPVGEDARDEIVTEPRVGQAPFLFDGQERIGSHQPPGEESGAASRGHARVGIDLHALHAARWRRALENIAGEPEPAERAHPRARIGLHGLRQVRPALGGDEPWRRGVSHQTQRFAGSAQPQLHLGTHRHPREMPRQRAGDVAVLLMAAVVADGLAEKAGGDADLDLEVGGSPGRRGVGLACVRHHAVLYRDMPTIDSGPSREHGDPHLRRPRRSADRRRVDRPPSRPRQPPRPRFPRRHPHPAVRRRPCRRAGSTRSRP